MTYYMIFFFYFMGIRCILALFGSGMIIAMACCHRMWAMDGIQVPTISAAQFAYEERLTADAFNIPPSEIAHHLSPEEYSLVYNQMINDSFYTDDLNNLFESLEGRNENINILNGANRMIYIEE